MYSCTMEGVVACLTGFRNDKDLAVSLVHTDFDADLNTDFSL